MTTIELFDDPSRKSVGFGFLGRVGMALVEISQRREERRTVVKLSRKGPRLIRDMGLDPAAVYGALDGTWDEVQGDRFPRFDKV